MPIDNAQSSSPNSSQNAEKKENTSSFGPKLKIVAGPNGAGKSTFAEAMLVDMPYINGDEIKRLARINSGIRLDTFSISENW